MALTETTGGIGLKILPSHAPLTESIEEDWI